MQSQSRLNFEFLKNLAPEANKHLMTDTSLIGKPNDTSVSAPYYSPTSIVVNLEKIEKAFREVGYYDNNTKEFKPLNIPEGSIYKKHEIINDSSSNNPSDSSQIASEQPIKLDITFINSDKILDDVYVYSWVDYNSAHLPLSNEFPGMAMLKKDNTNEYYESISLIYPNIDINNINIIFNNGNSSYLNLTEITSLNNANYESDNYEFILNDNINLDNDIDKLPEYLKNSINNFLNNE